MATENAEITIQFLGGAGTVTGSKTLIKTEKQQILVDCGLFQGLKELRIKNREKFPVNEPVKDVAVMPP